MYKIKLKLSLETGETVPLVFIFLDEKSLLSTDFSACSKVSSLSLCVYVQCSPGSSLTAVRLTFVSVL